MRARRCMPAESGPYRYVLEVALDASGPRLVTILKNPSTAGADRSDPTVGKVEAWAARRGFGALVVVNLFARRATNPGQLNKASYADSIGAENDRYLLEAVASADVIAAGWGNPNGIAPSRYDRRIREVFALLASHPIHIVGPLTRADYPRHGLLWNGGCELASWRQ